MLEIDGFVGVVAAVPSLVAISINLLAVSSRTTTAVHLLSTEFAAVIVTAWATELFNHLQSMIARPDATLTVMPLEARTWRAPPTSSYTPLETSPWKYSDIWSAL